MKRNFKRLVCFLMSVMLVFSAVGVSARDKDAKTGLFKLEARTAEAVAGEDIHLTVRVENNPGINCARFALYYDRNYFSVDSSEQLKETFPQGFYLASKTTQYPYVMVIVSLTESSTDGGICEIVLKSRDTTPAGVYEFGLDYSEDDVCNAEGITVEFDVEGTSTTIKQGAAKAEKASDPLPMYYPNDGFKRVGSLDNFTKKNTYDQSTYIDLEKDAWYQSEVISAYEYALMLGKGNARFVPDATITLAEGVTLASRISDLYFGGNGEFKPYDDDPWYSSYLSYARQKRFYSEDLFGSDFNREITRKEFALLMSKALPQDCYEQINNISELPDLDKQDAAFEDILKLYNAGILTGNDSELTFTPDSPIKRCEVAAIVNRMAIAANRKTLS